MTTPPEEDQEIRARHLANFRELSELAMALARTAAQVAAAQLEAQLAPEPEPQPKPTADASSTPVRGADASMTFVRVARLAERLMLAEARIAAGLATGRASPARAPRPPQTPDRRRTLIRDALYTATQKSADRARRRRDIDERIEKELAADPASDIPAFEIFTTICADLEIEFDIAKLHDDLIGMPPRKYPPRFEDMPPCENPKADAADYRPAPPD